MPRLVKKIKGYSVDRKKNQKQRRKQKNPEREKTQETRGFQQVLW